jgi:hypothetical protein
MKNKRTPRFLAFLVLCILSVFASFLLRGIGTTAPLPERPVPASNPPSLQRLKPCLPTDSLNNVRFLANVRYGDSDYYRIAFVRQVPTEYPFGIESVETEQLTLILEDDIGCQVIVPPERGYTDTLFNFVPDVLAKQIALETLRYAIVKAGGKDAYLREFDRDKVPNSDSHGGPWIIFVEDAWASQYLGIPLPKNSQVVRMRKEVVY